MFDRLGMVRLVAMATGLAAAFATVAVRSGLARARWEAVFQNLGAVAERITAHAWAAEPENSCSASPTRRQAGGMWIGVMPPRVAPRNGRWTAKLTIAMVNERGEPSPVADDIPVRLRPTLGTVESEEVVIRKGTSIADVRITSDAPGCDTIYVLSSTAVNGPSAQVEYELPRPSRVSL